MGIKAFLAFFHFEDGKEGEKVEIRKEVRFELS